MVHKSEYLRQIDGAIHEGKSLEEIDEAVIDPAPVSDDMRSALWLYAIGALERAEVHAAPPGTNAIGA
jgi:hypothetical protein